jgi:subtilisin family serine protease
MKITHGLLSLALIPLLLVGLFLPAPTPQATGPEGPFSPSARQVLEDLPANQRATFIITLRDQLAGQGAQAGNAALRAAAALPGQAARHQAVITALQDYARQQQAGLLAQARRLQDQGQVGRLVPLWIFNGVSLEATPAAIRALAARPEVARVDPDPDPSRRIVPLARDAGAIPLARDAGAIPLARDAGAIPLARDAGTIPLGGEPAAQSSASTARPDTASPEPNVALVNAPALWSLGYTGQGVVVASLDTGVYASHPDLAPSYRGGSDSWFDPYGQNPQPTDNGGSYTGHGTMTMGLMVGDGNSGTAIGMAPGAKWIAAKIFDNYGNATITAIHLSYQWVIAAGADVVNNSWGYTPVHTCDTTFEPDIQALLAAGILPVFSSGNSGPNLQTDLSPANLPGAFAVGAVDNTDLIAYFSSRGPGACSSSLPFPYLVAPGVALKTTYYPAPSYYACSGTSCAAPEVSGALALLLSAFPHLSVNLQQEALVQSAEHLTPTVPDSSYGYGQLDVLAAYNWLASPLVVPNNLLAVAAAPDQIDLTWVDTNSNPNETGYEVQRSPDGQTGWVSIATTPADTTSYTDSGSLSEGTPYSYRVRAVNTTLGYYSNFDTASATTLLLAPTNLTAAAVSSAQIDLSWVNNSQYAGGTVVQRSPDGVSGWTTLGTAPAGAATFSDGSGLVEGTPYYYRVQTVNATQTLASLYASASAVTPLLAPSGLVAAPISNTQVNLFWTDHSTLATGYEVQRSPDGLTGWETLTAALPGTATGYSDTTAAQGTRYYYQVRATGSVPGSDSPFTPPAHAVTGPNWIYLSAISR